MKNKDRFNTLQEAQYDYYKYQKNCLDTGAPCLSFQGWLFTESEEKSENDYEHWHNIIVED